MTNLYEPYYRQSNLCALTGKSEDELMEFQFREQRTDVYAALDYFFENYNKDRPFILAGHSQGSLMLKLHFVIILKSTVTIWTVWWLLM